MTLRLLLIVLSAVVVGACSRESDPVDASRTGEEMFEAHCTEPLPIFTLGPKSHPTKEQEAALCSCIWMKLDPSEREPLSALSKPPSKSAEQIDAAMRPFAAAVKACGGMEL